MCLGRSRDRAFRVFWALPVCLDRCRTRHAFGTLKSADVGAPYQIPADTLVSLLQSCENIHDGQILHSLIVFDGQDRDTLLCNLVIRMYGKSGSIRDAAVSSSFMRSRNVFTWAIIINMYAQQALDTNAFRSFQQMLYESILPDKAVFVAVLSACSDDRILCQGKRIHACIVSCGILPDCIVGTMLLSMYSKCKRLDYALLMFAEMPTRNVVTWNAIMVACIEHGFSIDVQVLVAQMQIEGVLPDQITLACTLEACSLKGAVSIGLQLHMICLYQGLASDIVMGTSLINMYAKCGNLDAATEVFHELLEQDVVSRSAMIGAYVQYGYGKMALQLFHQMVLEGVVPNLATAISVLDSCSDAEEGKRMHAFMLTSGLAVQTIVSNALLRMYARCGDLLLVEKIFDEMPERNVVSWTEMIKACMQQGQGRDAMKHYGQMLMECVIPDDIAVIAVLDVCSKQEDLSHGKCLHSCMIRNVAVVGNPLSASLISFYGKCGHLDEARRILFETSKQDIVSWSALIKAHTELNHGKDAFQLFAQMQREGLQADRVCLVTVLDVCTCHAALNEGNYINSQIIEVAVESDLVLGTGLIVMYGKCGSLTDAQKTFDILSRRNTVSWNAIIGAHAQHGAIKQALDLFSRMRMEGCAPDHVSFQNVLSACRHGGLVDEGCQFFLLMCDGYGIRPTIDHFNSVADLLARAGLLDTGENLIRSMPCNPNSSSWITLLGACKKHVDFARGQNAAGHAFKLDSNSISSYVLLSNIRAVAHSEMA